MIIIAVAMIVIIIIVTISGLWNSKSTLLSPIMVKGFGMVCLALVWLHIHPMSLFDPQRCGYHEFKIVSCQDSPQSSFGSRVLLHSSCYDKGKECTKI